MTQPGSTVPFSTIRQRRRDQIIGSYPADDPIIAAYLADLDAVAAEQLAAMDHRPGRQQLWSDLNSSVEDTTHAFSRLRSIAVCWAAPGSQLFGAQAARDAVRDGLEWLLAHRYGSVERDGNWWQWEIGSPLYLHDLCVLMSEELAADTVARATRAIRRYTTGPKGTGANLVWSCYVAALVGVLDEDPAPLAAAGDALGQVFPYVSSGDGFYRDGSFVQHNDLAYNGGYGTSLIEILADTLSLLAGTPWDCAHPDRPHIYAWVRDGFAPFLVDGLCMDMVRGREVSRDWPTYSDHGAGHRIVAALLELAKSAPTEEASCLRALAKHHITNDTYHDYFSYPGPFPGIRSLGGLAEARRVVADPEVVPDRRPVLTKGFPAMARAVHRRSGFAAGIAMSSRTIANYESTIGEDLHGWHAGDGMTYTCLPGDPGHYADAFWATVDPYRLPGTTVEVGDRDLYEPKSRSESAWAGGAFLEGLAAFGMGLAPGGSSVRGSKSWFCVGDAIICLGAGIRASAPYRVETTMENRNLGTDGTAGLSVDGKPATVGPGWADTLTPSWLHVAGVGGYLLPAGSTLHAQCQDRTGRWADINHRERMDPREHTRTWLTLWFDHGSQPVDAAYAYVLLPGATAEQTSSWLSATGLRIVANSGQVQAIQIHDPADGAPITLANFFADHAPPVAGISVDQQASVMVRERDGHRQIALTHPPYMDGAEEIVAEFDWPASSVEHTDDDLSVEAISPKVRLRARVAGLQGKTLQARMRTR